MMNHTRLTRTLWVLMFLAGCAAPKPTPGQSPGQFPGLTAGYPPDLTLVFVVRAPVGDASPLRQPARYVIEPDRTLRVALGPGSVKAQYPPPTAKLSTAQMRRLHDLTRFIDWDTPIPPDTPDSPDSPQPGSLAGRSSIIYQVTLTRYEKTLQTQARPGQSPNLTALLAYLVELSGR